MNMSEDNVPRIEAESTQAAADAVKDRTGVGSLVAGLAILGGILALFRGASHDSKHSATDANSLPRNGANQALENAKRSKYVTDGYAEAGRRWNQRGW
jgi:hypothetical protein